MSTDMNPEKSLSSLQRSNTLKNNSPLSFPEKLKEIRGIVAGMHEERAAEVLAHLEELNEIYLAEVARDRQKYEKFSEQQGKGGKGRRSEKVILEVREGNKLMNEVKIEGQNKQKSPKSPDRKGEEKKFIKFEPKKAKAETTAGLVNILKNNL